MKTQQTNLFGEVIDPPQKDMLIIKSKDRRKKVLSKEQKKFNKYIRKIEKLSKEIEEKETVLEHLLVQYNDEIKPIHVKIAESLLAISTKFHHLLMKFKYTPLQQAQLGGMIVNFMDAAFATIEPDEDIKSIYDTYSYAGSYDELLEEDNQAGVEELIEMLEFQFGIEFKPEDIPNLKTASQEEIFAFAQTLKNKVDTEQAKCSKENQARKKTKQEQEQEQEREIREKAADELKNKSLRSLYLSLAKVLHPDSGGSEQERLQKNELMQQVTEAYKNKDLPTLLKLELQWLRAENEMINKKADEQLKIYNQVLKEQADELQNKLTYQFMHPRYADIHEYCFEPAKNIPALFQKEKETLTDRLNAITEDLNRVKNKKTSLEFLKVVNEAAMVVSPLDMLHNEGFDPFGDDDFPL